MTEADARAEIERKTAWDVEPELTPAEIDQLVRLARRPDGTGLVYTDAGWVPTWDTDAAAAQGWEFKAGKRAGEYSFSADGASFDRSEVVRSCQNMAQMYRRRVIGAIQIAPVV